METGHQSQIHIPGADLVPRPHRNHLTLESGSIPAHCRGIRVQRDRHSSHIRRRSRRHAHYSDRCNALSHRIFHGSDSSRIALCRGPLRPGAPPHRKGRRERSRPCIHRAGPLHAGRGPLQNDALRKSRDLHDTAFRRDHNRPEHIRFSFHADYREKGRHLHPAGHGSRRHADTSHLRA